MRTSEMIGLEEKYRKEGLERLIEEKHEKYDMDALRKAFSDLYDGKEQSE